MESLNTSEYQTFSCGNTKVMFDNNGYIIKAKGFMSIMWSTEKQDEELIGKHISELAQLLKKYAVYKDNYISFLENVVIEFYKNIANNNKTNDCDTCQNKICRIKQNEKIIDENYYINNEQENKEKTMQLLLTK